jgi:hypothetical protein
LSTSCPPRRSLTRSFLSLADVLPAAPLVVSPVFFTRRRLSHRAAVCIARFFLLPMTYPPRRSLHHSFVSLADFLPAVPLVAYLVSFTRRRLARRAARCVTRFFLLLTSCAPRLSLHRSFLSLADTLPAAPLAEPLVSLSC